MKADISVPTLSHVANGLGILLLADIFLSFRNCLFFESLIIWYTSI